MQINKQIPVLIIGSGISGLSAALFLLHHGIQPLLVERHKTTSVHPRSRGFDVRSMELYREIGLSEALRDAGEALASAWGIHTSRSLSRYLCETKPKKAVRSPMQFRGLEALMAATPETGARCTQDIAEPILLQAARDRGAQVLFNTELVSFRQDEQGVTAVVRNRETGTEQAIQAEYMTAADGAKSSIREKLGVQTVGEGPLGNLLNIYFEADLANYIKGKEFSLLRVNTTPIKGLLTSINNSDRWVFHLSYDPAKALPGEEELKCILQQVTG